MMSDTPGTLDERLQAEIERKRDAGGDMLYRGAPDPLLTEAADEIASLRAEVDRWIEAHRIAFEQAMENGQAASSLRARVEELETAGRYIKPYLVWTVGPESPGYHPTMPSAVGAFLDTLARQALKDTPDA